MVEYLFRDFLTDATQYEQAEACWHSRWEQIVRNAGEEELWQAPWMNTAFADGTPHHDGNPIFSAISTTRQLGIRVIQLEPSNKPQELYLWTDTLDEGDAMSINELVISCVATEYTLLYAAELMDQWVTAEEIHIGMRAHSTIPLMPRPIRNRRQVLAVA